MCTAHGPSRLRALTVLPRAEGPSAIYRAGGGNRGQRGEQCPDKVIVVSLDVAFGWMRIKVPYGRGPVLGSDREAFHSASPCLL